MQLDANQAFGLWIFQNLVVEASSAHDMSSILQLFWLIWLSCIQLLASALIIVLIGSALSASLAQYSVLLGISHPWLWHR